MNIIRQTGTGNGKIVQGWKFDSFYKPKKQNSEKDIKHANNNIKTFWK